MKKLIFGLGRTGQSTLKTLCSMGYDVCVYTEGSFENKMEERAALKDYDYSWIDKAEDIPWDEIDLCIKSPGISPVHSIIEEAGANAVEVVSDLELVTRLFPDEKVIAITGTNGKTTTSALVGHLLNSSGIPARVIGNIGKGMLWEIYTGQKEAVNVIECSSFQLEHTVLFKPTCAAILNISPDHLDWHGSMDHYAGAKLKIAKNLEGALVVNADDSKVWEMLPDSAYQTLSFSQKACPRNGAYTDGETLSFVEEGTLERVIECSKLKILGSHNRENAMAAMLLARLSGLTTGQIAAGLESFEGVAHRIEYVDTIGHVRYYNDSKGTNVDASTRAVQSMDGQVVLIAGGYDKQVPMEGFFASFSGKVVHVIALGQTADLFCRLAQDFAIPSTKVSDMNEAVALAVQIALPGMNVLLSPASASWGMYPNFEVRGDHFKSLVRKLKP